jgi:Ca-activated chloride channel family protein
VRLALAIGLALALPAPAVAQDFQPVVGGGSFNAAPILEPGSYRDTLLPTEYLYYAFRLEPGQRLHVTANGDMPIQDFQQLGLSDITANLHSPTRSRYSSGAGFDVRGNFRVEGDPPLDITGPTATAEEDTAVHGPWYGPGVAYLAFYAIYTGATGVPPKAEVPFHFEVEVQGTAQSTPTPSPSPSPSPTPTATPAPVAPDDDGVEPAVAAGFGVGGLLIGVIGGIALRRRRS